MRIARPFLALLVLSTSALCSGAAPKQLAELTASDGTASDGFGISVAMSGDTVVVGAPYATVGSNRGEGAAYVFVKPESGWGNMTQVAKLTVSGGFASEYFGYYVAISGDTVVIGSYFFSGAYVFVRPAGGWEDMTETAALDYSAPGLPVAVEGQTIVYGPYVFVKPKGGWVSNLQPVATLSETDPVFGDGFGSSVAISGNTIVVGAPGEYQVVDGAAYVFVRPAGGWANMTESAELTPTNGTSLDSFGASVGIDGGSIVVGATSGGADYGYAYVFVEPPGGWVNMTQTAELGVEGEYYPFLGFSVAIAGSKASVGAPYDVYGDNDGAVFLYDEPRGGWGTASQPNAELIPSAEVPGDFFGISVAASGATIVVGATNLEEAPGVAYVF